MATPPIPVRRYLVSPQAPTTPEGFQRIDQSISSSLPQAIDLGDGLSLLLVVPSGLARPWREADPTSIVSHSKPELAAFVPAASEVVGHVDRAPARLLMRIKGRTVASMPLVAGSRRMLPDSGQPDGGIRVELMLLGWDLRAGNLRGPGDYGSRISLAWRRADGAVEQFSTPPINPQLTPRLAPKFRMISALGTKEIVPLSRFRVSRVIHKR